MNISVSERFWLKVKKTSGCWVWTASKNKAGYGRFGFMGKNWLAPRLAYLFEKGEIPEGKIIRHSCDNPACVNPNHLLLGTRSDNLQDCIKRGRHGGIKKTHCPQGHEYTPENTRINSCGRCCRTCGREWALSYYYKNREEIISKRRKH